MNEIKHFMDLCYEDHSEEELESNSQSFDEVDWLNISSLQNISKDFIQRHFDKIDLFMVGFNVNVSSEIYNEILKEYRLIKEIV